MGAKPRGKKLLAVLSSTAFIASAVLTAYYFLPNSIDLTPYRERIAAIVEKKTGLQITADKISLSLRPRVLLSLSNVMAYKGAKEVASIKELKLSVPLASVFTLTPSIDGAEVDNARLFIRRSKNAGLNVSGLFGGEGEDMGRVGSLYPLKSLTVKDGFISFADEAVGTSFDITGIDINAIAKAGRLEYVIDAYIASKARVRLNGSAGVGADGKRAEFTGSGKVEGLDLALFNASVTGPKSRVSLKGTAGALFSYKYDGSFSVNGELNYKNAEVFAKSFFDAPLRSAVGGSSFTSSNSSDVFEFALTKAAVQMNGFIARGSLKMSMDKKTGKKPVLLNITTSAVPVKVFENISPIKALAKTAAGLVTVKNFSLSTDLTEPEFTGALKKPGAVNLEVELNNVSWNYAGFDKKFSGINGTLLIKNNTVFLKGASGSYNESVIEKADAVVKDPLGEANGTISLKASLEASDTLDIIKKFFKRQDSVLAKMLRTAKASGKASLFLEAKGSFKDIKSAGYNGTLWFNGVSFTGPDSPVEVKGVKGSVGFDNNKIVIKDVRLQDAFKSEVKINGYASDYAGEKPEFNIKAEGGITPETARALRAQGVLKTSLANELSFDGTIPFRVVLDKAGARARLEAFVDFTPVSLELGRAVKKAQGFLLTLEGSAMVDEKEVALNRFQLLVGSSVINTKGRFSLDRRAYDFTIDSPQLKISDIDDVVPYLLNDVNSSGTFSFDVNVKKPVGEDAPAYEGGVMLKDGRLSVVFMPHPIERLNASISFGKNSITTRLDSLIAGTTDLSGFLNITDIAGMVAEFGFNSTSFNTADIFKRPEAGRSAVTPKTRKFLIDLLEGRSSASAQPVTTVITGKGMVAAAKGNIFGQTFEDLQVELNADKNTASISRVVFNKNGGSVSGALNFYRDPKARLLLVADLTANGVQLEPFFTELGAKKSVLIGGVTVDANFEVVRRAPSFTAGINGGIHLSSAGGRLKKFLVLSKIFSIVNIVSITELLEEGLAYTLLSGDFTVKNGIIKTENLRLDSPVMRMSGAGEINLPGASINGYLGIHPFVTLDKIVTSVPLAGWIIGGRQKSAISMYYELTGALKTPEVEPVPIKGLGKGVFEMLQRFLEAPAALISPEKNGK
ncbi:hypothetical protein EPN18_04680 [bacterium]|nr:MAG: hypothetical protein EPN18_04680 [bacterium]